MKQSDEFYQAMFARDYRFDGKFFVGVKTTGIYCRPICPANKPKQKNVEFFPDALAAEKAGYRPCLRCRPESAPLSPAWMGRSATIQRALKLLMRSAFLVTNEDQFAEKLGVSARHLRRLFEEEIGKTPKQISDGIRLNFARKLVTETQIPITEIAFTSGFSSIRQFNDAFKIRFHQSPSELRKRGGKHGNPDLAILLSLPYRPPFDWKSLLHFYKLYGITGIENIAENSYERVFRLNGTIGAVRITQDPDKTQLSLQVSVSLTKSLYTVVQSVRQMFDLDSDPLLVSEVLSKCEIMSRLSSKFPGLRIPRGWDAFETSICAVLGQLVSTEQASRLVRQLVENYGENTQNPLTGEKSFLFPTAKLLATETLSQLGTTQTRKITIREFSRQVLEGKLRLDSAQDPELFRKILLGIKGIGPWTADYICLRALGDTNAFPSSDLILRRAIEQIPNLNVDIFKPWKAYAAIYLWKEFAGPLSKKRKKP